jgi:hypothetical protein
MSHEDGAVRVSTAHYRLTWASDRPFVYVDDGTGRRLAELFVLSSVHTTSGQDDTVRIGAWEVEEQAEVITLTLAAESSVWKAKRYTFECFPDRFRYRIAVEGQARITVQPVSVHFQPAAGSGFSGQPLQQGRTPNLQPRNL